MSDSEQFHPFFKNGLQDSIGKIEFLDDRSLDSLKKELYLSLEILNSSLKHAGDKITKLLQSTQCFDNLDQRTV